MHSQNFADNERDFVEYIYAKQSNIPQEELRLKFGVERSDLYNQLQQASLNEQKLEQIKNLYRENMTKAEKQAIISQRLDKGALIK